MLPLLEACCWRVYMQEVRITGSVHAQVGLVEDSLLNAYRQARPERDAFALIH
jgi:hypothetical protein